jgi:uncharacterized protein
VPHAFSSLPENLAAFCAVLRREYGFRNGPGELIDAGRALGVVPLADVRIVRHALRPVLSASADEAARFDDAFDRFFLRPGTRLESPALSGAQTREAANAVSQPRGPGQKEKHGLRSTDVRFETGDSGDAAIADAEKGIEERAAILRASYSPIEGEGTAPDLPPPDGAWHDAASALVARLRLGLSRRWRPARHGDRFDMRRTLRGGLHTGGELVVPRWRARPRRRPKFVVLVDGSRSMGAHALPSLRTAVALASVSAQVETFTFSTEVRRITGAVRRAAAGRPQRLEQLHHAWGGGTTIGACLREFLRRYAERLLGREAVVIVASDGLDVGDSTTVRDAMAQIRRLSAGIVWLNPLLDTPDYQPIALGMRAALPYVTTFTWVENAADLVKLSRSIRLR